LALALSGAAAFGVWQFAPGADGGAASPITRVQPPDLSVKGTVAKQAQKRVAADSIEDPLPKGAVARLGTTSLRHGVGGTALRFTPDGKYLDSLGGGWLRRWDVDTGRTLINLGDGPRSNSKRQLVSPDGKVAYMVRQIESPKGTKWVCVIYDMENGKERQTYDLKLPDKEATSSVPIMISPDGKLFAGYGSDVLLWNTADGTVAHHIKPEIGEFTARAFAPDSKTILVGDDAHAIHVFDLAAGKEQRTFGVADVKGVGNMAISPDGKWLVTVHGKATPDILRLWDVAKGIEERSFELPKDCSKVESLFFTPDSRTLLATSWVKEPPRADRLNTDYRIQIVAWDVDAGPNGRLVVPDNMRGRYAAVNTDGTVLATMDGIGIIRLWDMKTGKERRPLEGSPTELADVRFNADGKTIYTIGGDKVFREWDALTGRLLKSLDTAPKGHWQRFVPGRSALVLAKLIGKRKVIEKKVIGFTNDQWSILDPMSGKVLLDLKDFTAVFVLPNGQRIGAYDDDGGLNIYELETAKLIQRVKMPVKDGLVVHGFTADGQSLILQNNDIVSVMDVQTGKEKSSWNLVRNKIIEAPAKKSKKQDGPKGPPGSKFEAVALSPDGAKIAFAVLHWQPKDTSFIRISVLDPATGKLLDQIDDEYSNFDKLTFSPDGKLLAAPCGDWTARVWEVGGDKAKWRFEGHLGGITALAFSPDSKRLATTSTDSTALVWDLAK
ncbi:MAG TPA: WD40 repeat domain-containing protein, partial [Gemmataceae bacterium]|nr:WD40 repeat domain-containing protein [Gemmataceae bacterium]